MISHDLKLQTVLTLKLDSSAYFDCAKAIHVFYFYFYFFGVGLPLRMKIVAESNTHAPNFVNSSQDFLIEYVKSVIHLKTSKIWHLSQDHLKTEISERNGRMRAQNGSSIQNRRVETFGFLYTELTWASLSITIQEKSFIAFTSITAVIILA